MSPAEGNFFFLKAGFEVFLDTLLGMEAGRIVIGRFPHT
jgi:hypothetical protein